MVIEVPSPDRSLRREFVSRRLAVASPELLETIADRTARLAFAHLQEVLRLSGLLAIQAGRAARADDDVLKATEMVRAGYDEASTGFRTKLEAPFGLAPRKT